MFYWRDYWEWKFRYVVMTLGIFLCAGIIFIFPQPLYKKSEILVAMVFIASLTLVVVGGLLEVLFCQKILKNLSPNTFPTKARFELMREAIASRGYATLYALLSILILSIPVIIQEINSTYIPLIPLIGSIFGGIALGRMYLSITCERRARNHNPN